MLPLSGYISIQNINTELNLTSSTAYRSLNTTTTRKLLGKLSGLIKFSDAYSKQQGLINYPNGLPTYIAPSGYVAGTNTVYAWGGGVYTDSYVYNNSNERPYWDQSNTPPTSSGQYKEYFTGPTFDPTYNGGLGAYKWNRYVQESYVSVVGTSGYYTSPGQGVSSYPNGLPVYIT